nr:ATP synthase F0 subunit 6 [Tripetaloceroides tonkinensis]
MMTNLFSSFDPSTNLKSFPLNWMSTLTFMMLIPMTFWTVPSRSFNTMKFCTSTLHKEFNTLINNNPKGVTLMFTALFTFIATNNFMGMFPYIFTSTTHLTLTLSMALTLWMTLMLFGWTKKSKSMFTHLVPLGTPAILTPFMVCIETISNMIRPGTLAVRLSANMIAGHLLMTLIGSTGPKINIILMMSMLSIQSMLVILEISVAIIQAYVFSVLITLYTSEIH